jgi:hypothetical protein
MNDNGDKVINFPARWPAPNDGLQINIVHDVEQKKVGIVVSGFSSVEAAIKFLEDD